MKLNHQIKITSNKKLNQNNYNMNLIYRFHFSILAMITIIAISCAQQVEKSVGDSNNDVEAVNEMKIEQVDKNTLEGKWMRTDGEYRIEISNLSNNGKMNAGYFNPKSINVSLAQWTSEGGLLKIYIELRDQNYPGSNYTLYYMKDRKILAGEYYQAMERNKYKVEFEKIK
jgi:hypothetical protein